MAWGWIFLYAVLTAAAGASVAQGDLVLAALTSFGAGVSLVLAVED